MTGAHTWTHLGVTISFSPENGRFKAHSGGKALSAGSLDAIKAQIAKTKQKAFEPFEAYTTTEPSGFRHLAATEKPSSSPTAGAIQRRSSRRHLRQSRGGAT